LSKSFWHKLVWSQLEQYFSYIVVLAMTSEVIVFIFKDLYVNVVTTLMKDVNQTKNIIIVVYFIQVIQVILGSPGQRSLGIHHLSLMPLDTY
jgi:hypothetical protein